MKKFLLFILTIIYLCVSSGFAMEIHYCMGKEAGVDFYKTSGSKKCGRCGMKDKKGGCCKDEHQFYKLADAHKVTGNDTDFNFSTLFILADQSVYKNRYFLPVAVVYPLGQSPPPLFEKDIYIRNCNFRL